MRTVWKNITTCQGKCPMKISRAFDMYVCRRPHVRMHKPTRAYMQACTDVCVLFREGLQVRHKEHVVETVVQFHFENIPVSKKKVLKTLCGRKVT